MAVSEGLPSIPQVSFSILNRAFLTPLVLCLRAFMGTILPYPGSRVKDFLGEKWTCNNLPEPYKFYLTFQVKSGMVWTLAGKGADMRHCIVCKQDRHRDRFVANTSIICVRCMLSVRPKRLTSKKSSKVSLSRREYHELQVYLSQFSHLS